jgi:hypothetical protein
MHHVRGQSIKQVRVIDTNQEAPLTLLGDKRINETPDADLRIRNHLAQRGAESAERQWAGRLGTDNPARAHTGNSHAVQDFTRESSLPDTRGPDNHNT